MKASVVATNCFTMAGDGGCRAGIQQMNAALDESISEIGTASSEENARDEPGVVKFFLRFCKWCGRSNQTPNPLLYQRERKPLITWRREKGMECGICTYAIDADPEALKQKPVLGKGLGEWDSAGEGHRSLSSAGRCGGLRGHEKQDRWLTRQAEAAISANASRSHQDIYLGNTPMQRLSVASQSLQGEGEQEAKQEIHHHHRASR